MKFFGHLVALLSVALAPPALAQSLPDQPSAGQTSDNSLTSPVNTRDLALQAVIRNGLPVGAQPLPAGFNWDSKRFPISIVRDGARTYRVVTDPKTYVADIFQSPTIYFANAAAANNAGDGRAPTTAKRSINSALSACNVNAAATSCLINVAGGIYDRNDDLTFSAGTKVDVIKPTAIVCNPSPAADRCLTGPIARSLTWTANGSAFTAPRSAVVNVVDLTRKDADGFEVQLPVCADLAAVQASTECFASVGADVIVKRLDGQQPSDANTRVLVNGNAIRPGTAPVNFYMSGFDVWGGAGGNIQVNDVVTGSGARNVVIVDTIVRYPGVYGGPAIRSIGANYMAGIIAIFDVTGAKGPQDFFSLTQTDPTRQLYGLAVNSRCYDFGRIGNVNSGSNNCYTMHDGAIGIDVMGQMRRGSGGTLRNIGATQFAGFGTLIDGDRGDLAYGGASYGVGAQFDDTAKAWLQEVTIRHAPFNLVISSGATVFQRNLQMETGVRQGSGKLLDY